MEEVIEKAIVKLSEAIKLPRYYNAIQKIVTRIYERGFKLSFHNDNYWSSAKDGIIKVGFNKKDKRDILWDVFHEFGHLLDPLSGDEETSFNLFSERVFKDKKFETQRELNAWNSSDGFFDEFPEMTHDGNDYKKYKDECLASYAFSFDPEIQDKMNVLRELLKLGREYDSVIGRIVYLIYSHPNKCKIELFNIDKSAGYKVTPILNKEVHQIQIGTQRDSKKILWELMHECGHLYDDPLKEEDKIKVINSERYEIKTPVKRRREMFAWKFAVEEFIRHRILRACDLEEFKQFKLSCLDTYSITPDDYKEYIKG